MLHRLFAFALPITLLINLCSSAYTVIKKMGLVQESSKMADTVTQKLMNLCRFLYLLLLYLHSPLTFHLTLELLSLHSVPHTALPCYFLLQQNLQIMKVLGQPIFFIIWRFSLLRGTNLLKSVQMVHWKNFIMRCFSLLGEFIIRGSTVHICFF